jgi:hypothetical protein
MPVTPGPDAPLRRVGAGGRTEEFPPNDLTPEGAVQAIADATVEWLYVFGADGRQIARFRGTEDEVSISDELAARHGPLGLYGVPVLKDCMIVHNHPWEPDEEVLPISPTDLFFAVTHDLDRLVVISGSDRFELRRPGNSWPIDDTEVMPLFQEFLENAADAEDQSSPTPSFRIQRNLRAFGLMAERGLIHLERHRSSRHH